MMPSPLHPAVVHFPVALLILGAVASVLAVFIRGWSLPAFAATLLALGTLGAFAAAVTGEQEEDKAEAVEVLLENHEEAATQTRVAAVVATVLACFSAAMFQRAAWARGLGVAAAVTAIAASVFVARTGHLGGQLVYDHAVGVHTLSASSRAAAPHARHDD